MSVMYELVCYLIIYMPSVQASVCVSVCTQHVKVVLSDDGADAANTNRLVAHGMDATPSTNVICRGWSRV